MSTLTQMRDEARDEFADALARCSIGDLPVRVDHVAGSRPREAVRPTTVPRPACGTREARRSAKVSCRIRPERRPRSRQASREKPARYRSAAVTASRSRSSSLREYCSCIRGLRGAARRQRRSHPSSVSPAPELHARPHRRRCRAECLRSILFSSRCRPASWKRRARKTAVLYEPLRRLPDSPITVIMSCPSRFDPAMFTRQ